MTNDQGLMTNSDSLPPGEVFGESLSQGARRIQQHIVTAIRLAAGPEFLQVRLQRAQIGGTNQVRSGAQVDAFLHAFETDHAVEWKAQLIGMQRVENGYLVSLKTQVA